MNSTAELSSRRKKRNLNKDQSQRSNVRKSKERNEKCLRKLLDNT